MHVFIPPLRKTLVHRQATFHVPLPVFVAAAREAAPQIVNAFGQGWSVDGHKSDRLYLRMECDPELCWFAAIETDMDLTVTNDAVTVGILTRSDSQLAFFDQFVFHLGRVLPRSTE